MKNDWTEPLEIRAGCVQSCRYLAGVSDGEAVVYLECPVVNAECVVCELEDLKHKFGSVLSVVTCDKKMERVGFELPGVENQS